MASTPTQCTIPPPGMNLDDIQANLQALVFMTANLNAQLHAQLATQPNNPSVPRVPCLSQKPLVTTSIQSTANQQSPLGYAVQPVGNPGFFDFNLRAEKTRQQQLKRYRAKRNKRNHPKKRVREEPQQSADGTTNAKQGIRNETGQFAHGKIQKTTERDLANKLASSQDECSKLRNNLSAKEEELRLLRLRVLNQHLLLSQMQRLQQQPGSPHSLSQPGTPMSVNSPMSVTSPMSPANCYGSYDPNMTQNTQVFSIGGPPTNIYTPPHPGNLMTPAFQSTIQWEKIALKKRQDLPDYLAECRQEASTAMAAYREDRENIANEYPPISLNEEYLPPWSGSSLPTFRGTDSPQALKDQIDYSRVKLRKTEGTLNPYEERLPMDVDDAPCSVPTPTANIWKEYLENPGSFPYWNEGAAPDGNFSC